ncbi:CRISPR-associated endoribonuclease Cas6 [Mangrovihabitans endophyticus]|uniref:CRISPR-associated endoribonuclease Cas6 n=1 Tax=Mangrovihabitans endophyticus TaxID=1751298 RepID=UPI001E35155A|nr:CRISPR-associated endoribonuclease Cas6 [Mangrovihabitans endophyticus]
MPALAAALLAAVAQRDRLRWGPATLRVKGVQLDVDGEPEGTAVLSTQSPVLLKGEADRYLLPGDDGYASALVSNIRRKADVLGLPDAAEVEVLEAGPRRRYEVSGGWRIGASLTARVTTDPRLLSALRAWGLGLGNIQGFGWIR